MCRKLLAPIVVLLLVHAICLADDIVGVQSRRRWISREFI